MSQLPLNHEPYKITISEAYVIVKGTDSGKYCPEEIWIYDQYVLTPTGCIFTACIARSFVTDN